MERDDDHSAQAQHRHIGGYEDEGDEDFAPPTTWVAVKLLRATRRSRPRRSFPRRRGAASAPPSPHTWSAAAKSTPGIDSLTLMVDARYAAIEKALNPGSPRQREHETTISDKIDRVLTHRVFAFPIFFAVLR